MKNFFRVLLSTVFLAVNINVASALGISPYIVDLSTEAGKEGNKTIKVFNDSKFTYSVKVYPHDITVDNNGNKIHNPPVDENSTAKYLEISPKNLVLKPNESKEVKVVVKTPKNWTGGKQSVVFFDAKPDIPTMNGAEKKKIVARLELNLSLGALVLQEIKGTTEVKSRITKAEVTPKKNGKKLAINIDVANEGNTHIKTSGFISILDESENFVGKVELPNTIVFPGKNETLKSNWEGQKLAVGNYHALITYEYGEDKSVIIDRPFKIQ